MFELANPWVLLFVFLPPLIWFFLPKAKPQMPSALKIPFFHYVSAVTEQEKNSLQQINSLLIPSLIWLLTLIALSGPRWVGPAQPMTREGYNIMMVLDLSGSMEMRDMVYHGRAFTRLQVVKQAAENFVSERSGDKIGLILFGTRAYLLSPLTYDRQTVLNGIADATAGLAGQTTSIGDALGLAAKHLRNAPKNGRVIIMLTDGANNSGNLLPEKAAELARSEQIKVYTIGLGADTDPRALSNPFFIMGGAGADLDEDTLKSIAKETGGRYFRATDPQSLSQIYQTINKLEKIKQEQANVRPQIEYYVWPLATALLLFFYWLFMQSSWSASFLSTKREEGDLRYDN